MHRALTTETFGKPTSNSIPTIIRNEEELNRIREYIVTNPQRWGKDELYIS